MIFELRWAGRVELTSEEAQGEWSLEKAQHVQRPECKWLLGPQAERGR